MESLGVRYPKIMRTASQILLPLALAMLSASRRSTLFSVALSNGNINTQLMSRRDALIGAGCAASFLVQPSCSTAGAVEAESVDLAAFNAARAGGAQPQALGNVLPGSGAGSTGKVLHGVVSSVDPSPLLPIRGGKGGKSAVQIPRVGYSLYKTPPDQVARCVALALRCGVRHFDVASLYGSSSEAYRPLKLYLDEGFLGLTKGKSQLLSEEKDELLLLLDETSKAAEEHAVRTVGARSKSIAPPIDGSAGRKARRDQLFVSHKLSNNEQSSSEVSVKRAVKAAIAELGVGYLDLVSIHSPLTDRDRRLATYRALLELRDAGFVRSVGVCNYGVGPLKEIEEMVGPDRWDDLPSINQMELSPFNAHGDVVSYCDSHGIAVGCSAWSKLSGVDGPAEGWAVLADLAKSKGVTKAQLLVRWSLQKGYVCVPRSGSKSKVERVAIAENSYGGVNPIGAPFTLSEEDMKVLDGLDIGYKAGKLGRRDGWDDGDVAGPEWDPTEVV